MEVIEVNKKILGERKDLEVTNEVIVPDSKPDMVNIIASNGIAYAHKEEISSGVFSLNGNVDLVTAYLSSDGNTRSIQTVLDFKFKVETPEITDGSFVKYDIKVKQVNARMLNERKFVVTAKLEIKYRIYEKREVKFYNDFENIEGLQRQEETLKLNSVVGLNSAKASINEKIATEMDNVSEILKTDISLANVESKVSYNKILAKAEVNISMIYLTEDDRIGSVSESFPVMSFIEIPNVKEENICNLDFKMRNVLFKINNGDEHEISTEIDFEIMAEIFEERTINVVNDLYSLKSDLDYTKNEIELETADKTEGEIIQVDEKIDVINLKKVLDVEAVADISNSDSPEINLKIYYELTDRNGLNIKEVKVPIMAKIEKNKEYEVSIESKEFSSDENSVAIQVKLKITMESENFKKVPMIQDVRVKETESKDDYSVVVYFVKPNDTIWKIAKNFKVSMETLIKINDLENPDLIYPGDKLYVLK